MVIIHRGYFRLYGLCLSIGNVLQFVWGRLDELILDAGFWILDGGNLRTDPSYLLDTGFLILGIIFSKILYQVSRI